MTGEAVIISFQDSNNITYKGKKNNGAFSADYNTSLSKGQRFEIEHDWDYVEISSDDDIAVLTGGEYSQDFHLDGPTGLLMMMTCEWTNILPTRSNRISWLRKSVY